MEDTTTAAPIEGTEAGTTPEDTMTADDMFEAIQTASDLIRRVGKANEDNEQLMTAGILIAALYILDEFQNALARAVAVQIMEAGGYAADIDLINTLTPGD